VPTLRLASFNIKRGTDHAGRVRLRALRDACRSLDADVLGLQEVWRRRLATRLLDESAYVARRSRYAHRFASARPDRRFRGYGNALLTRGRILDTEIRTLPGLAEREVRVALLANVAFADARISVAVTHLQNYPAHWHHVEEEAPEQLRTVLAWLRERQAPRVLLADLNLEPRRAELLLREAGFTVAATGPAFPAHRPQRQVDYIAVDGLTLTTASVAPRAPISDHRPIVAEVKWPPD
jgi:endonuclease/exonuclease/phosphatase family metal-dependent hydrolase